MRAGPAVAAAYQHVVFAGIEQRRLARQVARFRAALAVEIARGLLDQRHAFVKSALEQRRAGEGLQGEIVQVVGFRKRHAARPPIHARRQS